VWLRLAPSAAPWNGRVRHLEARGNRLSADTIACWM
jgi:hypothetical protein